MKLILTTDDPQKLYAFLDQKHLGPGGDGTPTPLDYERTECGCSIRFNPMEPCWIIIRAEDSLAEGRSAQISFECEAGEGLYEAAQLALLGWDTSGTYEYPYNNPRRAVERLIESFKPPTA